METQEQHETDTPPEAEASPNGAVTEESPATRRSVDKMFEYSSFVHVGPGASDCEDGEDGSCGDPLHFHAWCRLPNRFQINSIREKAQAAKARAVRQLRDPETDKSAILESDMETLLGLDDKESLVAELLSKTYWRAHIEAVREVAEEERFEHIEEDQERWRVLDATDPEQRDQDEYNELIKHLDAWNEAVDKARDERQEPERQALEAKSIEELVDLIRTDRITAEANQAFMATYSVWEWFIGTLKPRDSARGTPVDRAYGSVEQLRAAAPEIIQALEEAFNELESDFTTSRQDAARAEGNS